MNGIRQQTLFRLTAIYLALPLFIFILSWLDYGFAFVFGLLFGLGFYKLYKTDDKNAQRLVADNRSILCAFLLALIWCFFAGIGYFYYQSWDYHFRNALFRDLLSYDWPVMYQKANTPLVYYMGFWLVPAVIAKFWGLFIHNPQVLFLIGNVLLFLWAALGVTLVFIHLKTALDISKLKSFVFLILGFIFFSGLDIIGYKYFQIMAQPFDYHLDWWASFIQYSSFSTSMFWVFNQFITTALMVFTVYNGRTIQNFGFWVPLILFLAPYPTAGIGIMMLVYTIQQFCLSPSKSSFVLQKIFSIQNIIGVFWLLPVVVLYFITNSEGMDKLWYVFSYITPERLILFMTLEFLLYVVFIGRAYYRDIFFVTAVGLLLIIPFFRIDQQNNFCMRASIPALVILALFVGRFLFDNMRAKKHLFSCLMLFVLLIIGAATPIMEFYRGIHYVAENKKIALVKDEIYTLDQALVRMPEFGWDANHQYTAKNYNNDIFWQYLAKRHSPF